jgi:hypothetical protein
MLEDAEATGDDITPKQPYYSAWKADI